MAKPSCKPDNPSSPQHSRAFPPSDKKPDHLQPPSLLPLAEKPHQPASEVDFMALATSNTRISHAFIACKKPKSQVSKKCEMMELRPNAAPGSARGAWICSATIYFPPSPKGSRYSLRNMSKGISASPQVRKLVSLYTGSKHYHTGKAASSVVILLQGCSAKPSRPDSLGEVRLPQEHGQPHFPKASAFPKQHHAVLTKVLQTSST